MVGLTRHAPFGSDFECTTACTGEIRVLPHISATLVEQYANDSSGKMQQLQQSTVISTLRKDPPVATGAQGIGDFLDLTVNNFVSLQRRIRGDRKRPTRK